MCARERGGDATSGVGRARERRDERCDDDDDEGRRESGRRGRRRGGGGGGWMRSFEGGDASSFVVNGGTADE